MMKRFFPYISAFLAGAVGAFSMPPYGWAVCIFISISWLWLIIQDRTTIRRTFFVGWLFGFGYCISGLWWIGNSLLIEGSPYRWAYPLAVVGLPFLLAFFQACSLAFFAAIAGYAARQLRRSLKPLESYSIFCVALWAAEWTRSHWFTGFPWNLYGMAWMDWAALQSIYYIGIMGLTAITIIWGALPAFVYTCFKDNTNTHRRFAYIFTVAGVTVFALLQLWGLQRLEHNPTLYNKDVIVHLVQPNIPQNLKWDHEKLASNFEKTLAVTRNRIPINNAAPNATRVIVWPETALSYPVLNSPDGVTMLERMITSFPQKTYLATGILRRSSIPYEERNDHKNAYYNSLQIFNVQDTKLSVAASFDKFHLVPFGEYIPFQQYVPFGPVVQFSGFQRGDGPQTLKLPFVPPFSPLICYEIIFSGNVVTEYNNTAKAEWIINATNDGWYGVSPGPYQHLAQARLRAIEEGIPVIRSANTGISAVIDSYGRIAIQAPLNSDSAQEILLPLPITNR